MNLSLETILTHGHLMDAAGVLGLGLLGVAAIKLARKHSSWGGTMMAVGVAALLVARLYLIISPYVVTNDLLYAIGPVGIALMIGLPPLLLAMGLAGIVWGLWGHERWLHEEAR